MPGERIRPLRRRRDGTTISYGRVEVLVPGAQFSPKAWLTSSRPEARRFGNATNPTQLLIRQRRDLSLAQFDAEAGKLARAAKLYAGTALVFVHGFNVSFDEALQRAAQLRRDLNYDSALFVFSWPSRGSMWRYGTDLDSAAAAAKSLAEFLAAVEHATGAEKIHLVAHSMGNRVLLPALKRIAN